MFVSRAADRPVCAMLRAGAALPDMAPAAAVVSAAVPVAAAAAEEGQQRTAVPRPAAIWRTYLPVALATWQATAPGGARRSRHWRAAAGAAAAAAAAAATAAAAGGFCWRTAVGAICCGPCCCCGAAGGLSPSLEQQPQAGCAVQCPWASPQEGTPASTPTPTAAARRGCLARA